MFLLTIRILTFVIKLQKKILMKNNKVYPTVWQTMPFSLDVLDIWKKKIRKKSKRVK